MRILIALLMMLVATPALAAPMHSHLFYDTITCDGQNHNVVHANWHPGTPGTIVAYEQIVKANGNTPLYVTAFSSDAQGSGYLGFSVLEPRIYNNGLSYATTTTSTYSISAACVGSSGQPLEIWEFIYMTVP